ncbi:hypothetical protein AMTRI_Chr06g173230 [Amborella trichopoda]
MGEALRKTFKVLISSSNSKFSLLESRLAHSLSIKSGFLRETQVQTSLIKVYSKFRCLGDAHKVFSEIIEPDIFQWTLLINEYTQNSRPIEALQLLSLMLRNGVTPNCFTFASASMACSSLGDLTTAKVIHGLISQCRYDHDIVLANSIIHMYAKCGGMEEACRAYDMMPHKDHVTHNIILGAYVRAGDMATAANFLHSSPFKGDILSWNTVISGCLRKGLGLLGLELFYEMSDVGLRPNAYTLSLCLALFGRLALLELGKETHALVIRLGFYSDSVIGNSLIDMYSKCGELQRATRMFVLISEDPNTNFADCQGVIAVENSLQVPWSSMVAGYAQNGMGEDALKLFIKMLHKGLKSNVFTLTSLSMACAEMGILNLAAMVHAQITKTTSFFDDVVLGSAAVDMYAKCGAIHEALGIFNAMKYRNLVSWTSIIAGCAQHGLGLEAIRLFETMIKEGIKPNEISFVGLLCACSQAGLVSQGLQYFKSMTEDYGVAPGLEHYTCMVHLLGRAGLLKEAEEFIFRNHISDQVVVWTALLSACRIHNSFKMGRWVSEKISQLEPFNAGSYVLLSNMYANSSRWGDAANVRNMMRGKGVEKKPGRSWIPVKNVIHSFVSGDRSHHLTDDIYCCLERLMARIREVGYFASTGLVMHDVEEEQGEVILRHHSEKLAVAFGIISIPCGLPIRVMKNLRVCNDCHTAIGLISQVTGREIILRDAHRFHTFRDGQCSCGSYW